MGRPGTGPSGSSMRTTGTSTQTRGLLSYAAMHLAPGIGSLTEELLFFSFVSVLERSEVVNDVHVLVYLKVLIRWYIVGK